LNHNKRPGLLCRIVRSSYSERAHPSGWACLCLFSRVARNEIKDDSFLWRGEASLDEGET